MVESFNEFFSKEHCRECSTAAVLCLRPCSGNFVKIFGYLRLLTTKICERSGRALLIAIALLLFSLPASAESSEGVQWRTWSNSIFSDAKTSKRLILLNLEAVWCHWCHVMAEKTYSDPKIKRLLATNFIAVKADQDANPDLSARYRDFGWPATIILDSSGIDLRKLQGFVEPEVMRSELEAVLKNPKPTSAAPVLKTRVEALSVLSEELRKELEERHYRAIDMRLGGLITSHRYLDPGSVEYALLRGIEGSAVDLEWATKTLDANQALIDPVWGGVYQYSVKKSWDNPHFEKIMSSQANNILLYGLGYAVTKNERYKEAGRKIIRYLETFLRSEVGAFYTSQDSDVAAGEHSGEFYSLDDSARRRIGVPRIDKNMYARENGMAIEALATFYAVTGDDSALRLAEEAARWVVDNRAIPGGGFKHGEKDRGGPYLGDSLTMARATLALYVATANRVWLEKSRETASFITSHFTEAGNGGYASVGKHHKAGNVPLAVRNLEENASLARYFNSIYHYTGDESFRKAAERAFAYVGEPRVALETLTEPIVLLAGSELASEPPHLTIVGAKGEEIGKLMYAKALSLPFLYRRVEWWDRSEGAMPNPDVGYPKLPKTASFVCAQKRCSLPIFDVTELESHIGRVLDGMLKAKS